MLDFQRELLNRFLVAAAMAKTDGFENTAVAMLAVAEDMYKDISARSEVENDGAFRSTSANSKDRNLLRSAH